MSDTAAGNGAAADQKKQPQLRTLAQYVKDLSFESPGAPQSLQQPGTNPGVGMEVQVGARKINETTFESAIEFSATAKTDERVLYKIELVYAGVFHLENIPAEAVQSLLMINCPMLVFPFLRRIVADLTREGGFPPLLLEPIDFAALYQQNVRSKKAAKAEGAAKS